MSEQRLLKILIVDDERVSLRHFASVLEPLGSIELHRASSLVEALSLLEQYVIDAVFIDLQLSPDIRNRDGLKLLAEIQRRYHLAAIVVTGHDHYQEVLEAVKLGAQDYVLKTDFEQRAPLIIDKLREELSLKDELVELRTRELPDPGMGIIGTSVAMQNLRALIKKAAATVSMAPANVLILGPTGAGKEVVARALHQYGSQRSAPFLDLNCGAIAEALIEDQLFGHVKGAFTDAKGDQDGYFSLAGQGTLFLDEVGELSLGLQAKLLRVLETRSFRPLGPTARELHFKGRIIAATHVDLKERVRERRFREDLYYRLNVLTLHVPPLAEHPEDIPALIQHFLKKITRPLYFTKEAIEQLSKRAWPGNVRELRSAIEKLAYLADSDRVEVETLVSLLPLDAPEESIAGVLELMAQKLLTLPLEDKITSIEMALVQEAVKQSEGNITEAARRLGRHRRYVERALKKVPSPEGEELEE